MTAPGSYVVGFSGGGTALTIFKELIPTAPQNADAAVSLGVLWASASVAGNVIGIRFYKGGTPGGNTHTVGLYDAGGTLLASKVTSGEGPNGWQEVLFTTPVAITAGADYSAVIHWPLHQYPFTSGFFSGGSYSDPPFVAANCRFQYGGSIAFTPASNTSTGNFFSDILFVADRGRYRG